MKNERDKYRYAELISKNISDHLKIIKQDNVVIVPFTNLSVHIASRDLSATILRKIIARLKDVGYKVETSSFGYYTPFRLEIYGHPGSIAYNEITNDCENRIRTATKREKEE